MPVAAAAAATIEQTEWAKKKRVKKKTLFHSCVCVCILTHIIMYICIRTIYFILQQDCSGELAHTDITRLGARGGRPVLKTYAARNTTRVCVRARKVVVAATAAAVAETAVVVGRVRRRGVGNIII